MAQFSSRMTASILSAILFLACLVALYHFGRFWPEIVLVIGLCITVRQWLRDARVVAFITLIAFAGLYFSVSSVIISIAMIPFLFMAAAGGMLYLEIRDFRNHSRQ